MSSGSDSGARALLTRAFAASTRLTASSSTFYCHEARLVVEVDGSIHEYTQEEDALRQEFIESLGLRVIRFTNADVLQNLDGVLVVIAEVVTSQVSPSSPPV